MKRILLAIALFTAGQTSTQVFQTPVSLDVGPGSGEILIADLNRDGNLDIVTKHLMQNRITVSLGDGAGKFGRGDGSLMLPFGPGAVSLADMTGDGNADLLMAARYDGAEWAGVYPGNGRGGFTKQALVRLRNAMQFYKPAIGAADINEDGRLDLVAANGRLSTIEILHGDGRGGLGPVRGVGLEAGHDRYHFRLADVNGDGHLDLITTAGDQGDGFTPLIIATGNGQGQFREQHRVDGLRGARVESVADINGDARADVILSHTAAEISVLLNDGRGRVAAAPGSPYKLGHETHAIEPADVNGDGRVDLVAATNQTVTLLLNDGRGFSSASTFRAGPGAFQLAVADLNKDRRPDLLASSFEGNALTLLFGR